MQISICEMLHVTYAPAQYHIMDNRTVSEYNGIIISQLNNISYRKVIKNWL